MHWFCNALKCIKILIHYNALFGLHYNAIAFIAHLMHYNALKTSHILTHENISLTSRLSNAFNWSSFHYNENKKRDKTELKKVERFTTKSKHFLSSVKIWFRTKPSFIYTHNGIVVKILSPFQCNRYLSYFHIGLIHI